MISEVISELHRIFSGLGELGYWDWAKEMFEYAFSLSGSPLEFIFNFILAAIWVLAFPVMGIAAALASLFK